MGTGKSVVGKLLASELNRPFLDLDEKIEKEAGRTIAQIFAEEGEAAFRRLESEAVKEVSQLTEYVIATGGGVMLDEGNVQRLKSCGSLVCLTSRPEIILKRASQSLASRPLLDGPHPQGRIEELLTLRAPFYAKADVTMDTSERSVQEVVEEIVRWIREKL